MLGFFLQFIERIRDTYPEIYESGTGEGQKATEYFEQWGWYSSIYELAKGKAWKMDYITNMNIHEMHTFLAHKISLGKLKAELRKKK